MHASTHIPTPTLAHAHAHACTCTWGGKGGRETEKHTLHLAKERITLGQSIERIACRQVIAVHQNLSNKSPLFMTSHSAPPLLASAFKLILILGYLTRLSSMCSLTKPPQAGEPLCTLAQDLLFVDTLGEFISFQCLNII